MCVHGAQSVLLLSCTLETNWKCQPPSHTASSRCPLSSPVGAYLSHKLASKSPPHPPPKKKQNNASVTWHRLPYHLSRGFGDSRTSWQDGFVAAAWRRTSGVTTVHSVLGEGGVKGVALWWGRIMCLHDGFFVRGRHTTEVLHTYRRNTQSLKCNDSAVWHGALWTHTSASICLVHTVENASRSHCVFQSQDPGTTWNVNVATRLPSYIWKKKKVVYFPAGRKLIWSIREVEGEKKKPSANSKRLARTLYSHWSVAESIFTVRNMYSVWGDLLKYIRWGCKAQTCFSVDTSPWNMWLALGWCVTVQSLSLDKCLHALALQNKKIFGVKNRKTRSKINGLRKCQIFPSQRKN